MTRIFDLRPTNLSAAAMILAATLPFLAACQSAKEEEPSTSNAATYALTKRIGGAIAKCWFDEASVPIFGKYAYTPEPGNSPPRVLLVPKDKPTDLPVLVIESVGAAQVNLFGPLLDSPAGPRIRADVDRWTEGGDDCS
jgi:hypothetical protein